MNMPESSRVAKTPDPTLDRRNSPRLEVLGRIRGELHALDMPVTLLNLSDGGFLMQAAVWFTLGGTHEFRFTVTGHPPIVLNARVVHALAASSGGQLTYVVGLEFENQDNQAVLDQIATLVTHVQG
jgi:hypothetical protein